MKMLSKIKAFCIQRTMWIFLLVVTLVSVWLMLGKMKGDRWCFAVYMDGRGYYAQLPALLIFDDPNYNFYSSNSAVPSDSPDFLNIVEGKPVNKYFCGEPFLQLPFFATGHLIAKASGYKTNGYSQPYFYCFAIGALFYFLLGLFFLWKLLEKFLFRKRVILFVCLCYAFGTNLFHYAIYEPSMSHIYSFAAITAFLYSLRSFFLSPSRKTILLAAISLGIVALLRPVNLVVVLAFPVMAGDWKNVKAGFSWIRKNIFFFLLAILAFLLVCSVQLCIYNWETKHFFIWSYQNEGFDFSHPHFFGTLFSFEKGLFIYMPLTFISLFGFLVIARRSRYLLLSFLPLIAMIVWIVSAWHEWRYGYSFGLRAYVDYYALVALPMAFLIDYAFSKKVLFAFVSLVCTLLITLYCIQEYQFTHNIIHPGAMNKKNYWLVFLKTDDKYTDTITLANRVLESDGDFNDMEGGSEWPGMETIKKGIAFSGDHASRIDSTSIYSCAFYRNMSDNDVFNSSSHIKATAYIFRNDTTDKGSFVIAQVKDSTIFFLEHYPLPPVKKKGTWQEVSFEELIPKVYSANEHLKVFFEWKSGVVYVDDFKVEVKAQ
jgi:hypothetical protein